MRPHGGPKTLEVRRLRAIVLLRKSPIPWLTSPRGLASNAVSSIGGKPPTLPKALRPFPPKLADDDWARLEKLLLKGAVAAGFHTDPWTCPRIVELIRSTFGVRYHVDHIGRLLRSLGGIKNDWPRVKKTLVA